MAQKDMVLVTAERMAYLTAAADLATAADTMDRIASGDGTLETTPAIEAARRGIYQGFLEKFRAERDSFFAAVDARALRRPVDVTDTIEAAQR